MAQAGARPFRCRVVDSSTRSSGDVEVDESTSVRELRRKVLRLGLPLIHPPSFISLCHDGRELADDDATLGVLGVCTSPVIVACARQHHEGPALCPHPELAAVAEPPRTAAMRQPDVVSAAEAPPADALCRICFNGAYEHDLGKLISPCLCTGEPQATPALARCRGTRLRRACSHAACATRLVQVRCVTCTCHVSTTGARRHQTRARTTSATSASTSIRSNARAPQRGSSRDLSSAPSPRCSSSSPLPRRRSFSAVYISSGISTARFASTLDTPSARGGPTAATAPPLACSASQGLGCACLFVTRGRGTGAQTQPHPSAPSQNALSM